MPKLFYSRSEGEDISVDRSIESRYGVNENSLEFSVAVYSVDGSFLGLQSVTPGVYFVLCIFLVMYFVLLHIMAHRIECHCYA